MSFLSESLFEDGTRWEEFIRAPSKDLSWRYQTAAAETGYLRYWASHRRTASILVLSLSAILLLLIGIQYLIIWWIVFGVACVFVDAAYIALVVWQPPAFFNFVLRLQKKNRRELHLRRDSKLESTNRSREESRPRTFGDDDDYTDREMSDVDGDEGIKRRDDDNRRHRAQNGGIGGMGAFGAPPSSAFGQSVESRSDGVGGGGSSSAMATETQPAVRGSRIRRLAERSRHRSVGSQISARQDAGNRQHGGISDSFAASSSNREGRHRGLRESRNANGTIASDVPTVIVDCRGCGACDECRDERGQFDGALAWSRLVDAIPPQALLVARVVELTSCLIAFNAALLAVIFPEFIRTSCRKDSHPDSFESSEFYCYHRVYYALACAPMMVLRPRLVWAVPIVMFQWVAAIIFGFTLAESTNGTMLLQQIMHLFLIVGVITGIAGSERMERRRFEALAAVHTAQLAVQRQQAAVDAITQAALPQHAIARLHAAAAIADVSVEDASTHAAVGVVGIVDFAHWSTGLLPAHVVLALHRSFAQLDGLIQQFGVSKVATFEDSYVVVSGLGVDVLERKRNAERRADDGPANVEIATGPDATSAVTESVFSGGGMGQVGSSPGAADIFGSPPADHHSRSDAGRLFSSRLELPAEGDEDDADVDDGGHGGGRGAPGSGGGGAAPFMLASGKARQVFGECSDATNTTTDESDHEHGRGRARAGQPNPTGQSRLQKVSNGTATANTTATTPTTVGVAAGGGGGGGQSQLFPSGGVGPQGGATASPVGKGGLFTQLSSEQSQNTNASRVRNAESMGEDLQFLRQYENQHPGGGPLRTSHHGNQGNQIPVIPRNTFGGEALSAVAGEASMSAVNPNSKRDNWERESAAVTRGDLLSSPSRNVQRGDLDEARGDRRDEDENDDDAYVPLTLSDVATPRRVYAFTRRAVTMPVDVTLRNITVLENLVVKLHAAVAFGRLQGCIAGSTGSLRYTVSGPAFDRARGMLMAAPAGAVRCDQAVTLAVQHPETLPLFSHGVGSVGAAASNSAPPRAALSPKGSNAPVLPRSISRMDSTRMAKYSTKSAPPGAQIQGAAVRPVGTPPSHRAPLRAAGGAAGGTLSPAALRENDLRNASPPSHNSPLTHALTHAPEKDGALELGGSTSLNSGRRPVQNVLAGVPSSVASSDCGTPRSPPRVFADRFAAPKDGGHAATELDVAHDVISQGATSSEDDSAIQRPSGNRTTSASAGPQPNLNENAAAGAGNLEKEKRQQRGQTTVAVAGPPPVSTAVDFARSLSPSQPPVEQPKGGLLPVGLAPLHGPTAAVAEVRHGVQGQSRDVPRDGARRSVELNSGIGAVRRTVENVSSANATAMSASHLRQSGHGHGASGHGPLLTSGSDGELPFTHSSKSNPEGGHGTSSTSATANALSHVLSTSATAVAAPVSSATGAVPTSRQGHLLLGPGGSGIFNGTLSHSQRHLSPLSRPAVLHVKVKISGPGGNADHGFNLYCDITTVDIEASIAAFPESTAGPIVSDDGTAGSAIGAAMVRSVGGASASIGSQRSLSTKQRSMRGSRMQLTKRTASGVGESTLSTPRNHAANSNANVSNNSMNHASGVTQQAHELRAVAAVADLARVGSGLGVGDAATGDHDDLRSGTNDTPAQSGQEAFILGDVRGSMRPLHPARGPRILSHETSFDQHSATVSPTAQPSPSRLGPGSPNPQPTRGDRSPGHATMCHSASGSGAVARRAVSRSPQPQHRWALAPPVRANGPAPELDSIFTYDEPSAYATHGDEANHGGDGATAISGSAISGSGIPEDLASEAERAEAEKQERLQAYRDEATQRREELLVDFSWIWLTFSDATAETAAVSFGRREDMLLVSAHTVQPLLIALGILVVTIIERAAADTLAFGYGFTFRDVMGLMLVTISIVVNVLRIVLYQCRSVHPSLVLDLIGACLMYLLIAAGLAALKNALVSTTTAWAAAAFTFMPHAMPQVGPWLLTATLHMTCCILPTLAVSFIHAEGASPIDPLVWTIGVLSIVSLPPTHYVARRGVRERFLAHVLAEAMAAAAEERARKTEAMLCALLPAHVAAEEVGKHVEKDSEMSCTDDTIGGGNPNGPRWSIPQRLEHHAQLAVVAGRISVVGRCNSPHHAAILWGAVARAVRESSPAGDLGITDTFGDAFTVAGPFTPGSADRASECAHQLVIAMRGLSMALLSLQCPEGGGVPVLTAGLAAGSAYSALIGERLLTYRVFGFAMREASVVLDAAPDIRVRSAAALLAQRPPSSLIFAATSFRRLFRAAYVGLRPSNGNSALVPGQSHTSISSVRSSAYQSPQNGPSSLHRNSASLGPAARQDPTPNMSRANYASMSRLLPPGPGAGGALRISAVDRMALDLPDETFAAAQPWRTKAAGVVMVSRVRGMPGGDDRSAAASSLPTLSHDAGVRGHGHGHGHGQSPRHSSGLLGARITRVTSVSGMMSSPHRSAMDTSNASARTSSLDGSRGSGRGVDGPRVLASSLDGGLHGSPAERSFSVASSQHSTPLPAHVVSRSGLCEHPGGIGSDEDEET